MKPKKSLLRRKSLPADIAKAKRFNADVAELIKQEGSGTYLNSSYKKPLAKDTTDSVT